MSLFTRLIFLGLLLFSGRLAFGQATAVDAITFNGTGTVNTTFLNNAAASGSYTFVYKAGGYAGATTSQSGTLPAGISIPTTVTGAGVKYALVTANGRFYITRRVEAYSCNANPSTSWNQNVYTGPFTATPPATQSFSASSATVNGGSQVTITGTVSDVNANLTSVTIDYLAPGSSTWVIGTVAAGTAWSGAATASQTLSHVFTLTTFGTWQFRISGLDSLNASSGYTQTSVNAVNNAPTVQSLSSTPSSVGSGSQVTVAGSVADVNGNLTSVSLDYLAPGSSTWVIGSAGAGTAWSGAATASQGLSKAMALSGIGTWTFRLSGVDALGASSGYSQITINALDNAPVVQSFTPSTTSMVGGAALTLTGSVTDSDGNLTAISIDSLAPGAGSWTLGSVGAGTAWSGAATSAQTLIANLAPTTLGTWTYRISGTDAVGVQSTFTTLTVSVHDFYNGTTPTVNIVSGNNVYGTAGAFNASPFLLSIRTPGNQPYVNAPVTVTILSGGGALATSNAANATLTQTLSLTADANGNVQFYYQQPSLTTAASTIQVTAGTTTTTLTTYAYSAAEAATDPDGDGIISSVETLLGTNPTVAAQPASASSAVLLNVFTP